VEVVDRQDDPRQAAIKLAKHSAWAGLAFIAIVLVAVSLELFSRTLVHFGIIEKNGVLNWSILAGEYALAVMDVLLLIGVVGKQSWRLLKAV
jgi:hypothetical protein